MSQTISEYRKNAIRGGIVCIAAYLSAFFCGFFFEPAQSVFLKVLAPLFSLIGGTAFLYAVWCNLKAKGRSGWLLLLLVFSVVGLLILIFLRDKTKLDSDREARNTESQSKKERFTALLNQLTGLQRIALILSVVWICGVTVYCTLEYFNAVNEPKYFFQSAKLADKPLKSPLTFDDFAQQPKFEIGLFLVAITLPVILLWALADTLPMVYRITLLILAWIAAGFRKRNS